MSTVRPRFTASIAALALLVAAVASLGVVGAPSAGAFTLPSFYDVPNPLPPGGPGTVIKTEPVTVAGLHGTMQRVMYKSKSIRGDDIAVTGLIATPDTPPPAGGYKVLSWAHGTTGMADQCAPSLGAADALPAVNAFLDKGWLVTGTDYEGLGTPGLHPYIVGDSEARGVIDIVRAARDLSSDVSTDYVVWGHSQGGHASMFTAHIAHTWAPELHLVGAVAGAPPSQLNLVYDFLKTSPYKYYLLMVGGAINAAYGDAAAPIGDVLNAQGQSMLPMLDEGCTDLLAEKSEGLDVQSLMVQQADGTYNPFSNPVWGPLIAAQDPANFSTPVDTPILIIHGGADEQIPTVSSQILAGQLCATGQNIERWMYPGRSHAGVIAPSLTSMTDWIAARFAGEPAPDAAAPTGQDDIDDTICSDGKMLSRADYEKPSTNGNGSGNGNHTGGGSTAPVATPVRNQPTFTG